MLYTLHKRDQSEWKFWKFRVLRSKYNKFLFLKQKKVSYQSRNLVKLHESSRKSEILYFDWFLLSKSYKALAQKVQKSYLSWHWRVMQSLKRHWLVVSNTTWGIWWIFTQPHKRLKNFLWWAHFVQSIQSVQAFITLNSNAKF